MHPNPAPRPAPASPPGPLRVSIGQHSDPGRKPLNQDFHGAWVPAEPQLSSKGIALAVADGISSSEVSHIAAEVAVTGFLQDYYCTPEAWSVRQSAQRVLAATNAWLHAQTRRGGQLDADRGYVCTLSALVIKSHTAHLFHAGDARIYRLRAGALEPLTQDHRLWASPTHSYLSRALGVHPHLELDYQAQPVEVGDLFLLATDGVYEHASPRFMIEAVARHDADLDAAARAIAEEAYRQGSPDNLTVQLARVEALPAPEAGEFCQQLGELPFPPLPEARMLFDGYRILRELHASSRSHVYLAVDEESDTPVVLKLPSIDLREDAAYLERLLTEEWIARRLSSPHLLKAPPQSRPRRFLYTVSEYVEGQTLAQWMIDHPRPTLESVRGIVEQIAAGLRALHRLEMLHQDLRPENVLIDRTGTVKLIDFGAARVPGLLERAGGAGTEPLGTAQYTAPEYFLGHGGTPRSDQFSLGVLTYRLLCGGLPYGLEAARAHTPAAQLKLRYRPLHAPERAIPAWVDDVLRKAVHPDPRRRYEDLSEFIYELRKPSPALLARSRPPLIQRDPVRFWQGLALTLAVVLALVLAWR